MSRPKAGPPERSFVGKHLRWDVVEGKGLVFYSPAEGEPADGVGTVPTKYLRMNCPHRASVLKAGGGCPGCFARLVLALKMIREYPQYSKRVTEELFERLEAENAALRLAGGGQQIGSTNAAELGDEHGFQITSQPVKRKKDAA